MLAIDAIIQARLDSTRLPNKVLKTINGKTLLAHIVERIRLSKKIRKIIIACPDNALEKIKQSLSQYDYVEYFTGSEENVLERYYLTAKHFKTDIIVRATGDNPLVCPDFIDKAIDLHLIEKADLTHYLGIPLGTGVEIISFKALETAYQNAYLSYDKEHVTPYIYKHKDIFKVLEPQTEGFYFAPNLRVTIDNETDFQKITKLFDMYKDKDFITMDDIIHYGKIYLTKQ